jgi:hypothetical protein
VIGLIPLVGGAFNAYFCANRRNVNLILRHFGRVPGTAPSLDAAANDGGGGAGEVVPQLTEQQQPTEQQQQQQQLLPVAEVAALPVAEGAALLEAVPVAAAVTAVTQTG